MHKPETFIEGDGPLIGGIDIKHGRSEPQPAQMGQTDGCQCATQPANVSLGINGKYIHLTDCRVTVIMPGTMNLGPVKPNN